MEQLDMCVNVKLLLVLRHFSTNKVCTCIINILDRYMGVNSTYPKL